MSDTIPAAVIEAMLEAAYDDVENSGSICISLGHSRAALRAASAMGYELMPREPTDAMIRAGDDCDGNSWYDENACGATHWAAMFSAAPKVE